MARNQHALVMIGQNTGGLHTLAKTSQQLVTRAIQNIEDSRSEKSSLSSRGDEELSDKELRDVKDLRSEARRLANAGFLEEAKALAPKIEYIRAQKIRKRELEAQSLLESKMKAQA